MKKLIFLLILTGCSKVELTKHTAKVAEISPTDGGYCIYKLDAVVPYLAPPEYIKDTCGKYTVGEVIKL